MNLIQTNCGRGNSVERNMIVFSDRESAIETNTPKCCPVLRRTNETNPNKTKDFDLRQAQSVIYQRSRTGSNSQRLISNVQDPHTPAGDCGRSMRPGKDGRSHLAASVSPEPIGEAL